MVQLKDMAIKQKSRIICLCIFAFLSGLAIIGQAYFLVTIVDHIFLQKQSFHEIVPAMIGLLVVLIARSVFNYLSGQIGVKMASKVKRDLRKSLLNKYTANPVQASLKGQSGKKVSVILDAVDEIDSYFSSYIPQLIQASVVPLVILVTVFTQHIYSGLIIIVTAPFIPIFMIIIGGKTKQKSEKQLDKMAAFSGRFLDTLQGLTTLKLFGRANLQKEIIQKSSLDFRDATMEVLKIAFVSTLMLELISMLSIGLIALELSLRLIVFENIPFFTAFFILVLVPEFYISLKDLGSAFHTGRGSMGAAQKIQDELKIESEHVLWGGYSLSIETPPLIDVRDVSFSYGEDGFQLKNIHTQIKPYEQIAIVGKSGAGKTTLLHIIAGLIPFSEGDIYINDRQRSKIKEKDWFDQLSYISQDPYLFSGTVAENIAIGANMDVSRTEIMKAAQKAGIDAFIDSLESGYDTLIGEGGRGLSGGEKQRLAIARAFLKKPTVILFDEPTTGLDLHTEHILQSSLKELSKVATVITVAHRLHTITAADKIYFLDDGYLHAEGTHDELMASSASYKKMITIQQGGG
ncbi:thiol reductant ABC exporter subunit CydD [Virgibacillus alimentarius]|uniref:thiol reductant ABC exporter subunit CydD n=1 Tax=Virgibacillus alimentarius TaxID=698769 RepID=UPI0004936DA1|nr:thiol reductant ABC exporter subunit CydD [Virgibacillus alimentarius]